MALKILLLRKFSKQDTDRLKKDLASQYDLIIPDDYSEGNLIRLAGEANVFLGNKVSKALLDAAKKLKLVQVPGTGIDSLDLGLFEGRKVSICNSKSNTIFVAEYAIALLYSLIKKIPLHDRLMRQGDWFKPKNDENDLLYQSDTMYGKTIGFLGFGAVAMNIAFLLSGLRARYLAFVKNPEKARILPSAYKIDFVKFEMVLSDSDALFITLPLTAETKDMVTSNAIGHMKNGAYLINVSRAQIIDEEALYNALAKKELAGAAIDIWYDNVPAGDGKRYPSNRFAFHKLDNIILSPYRAGYIRNESPHLWDAIKNLNEFAKSGKLMNIIDPGRGY